MKTEDQPKKLGFLKKLINIFGFENKEEKDSNTESKLTTNRDMWVPDDKAQTCLYGCGKQFSALFLRKHHCRICGNVFCNDCCNKIVDGTYWGNSFNYSNMIKLNQLT